MNMRRRCDGAHRPDFFRYGGRGIKVCAEWQRFEVFRVWAHSTGYRDDLTLDRRENDGPYSPDNCRWVDRRTQAINRSSTLGLLNLDDVPLSFQAAADFLAMPMATLRWKFIRAGLIHKKAA
jgi:hypothetical protein